MCMRVYMYCSLPPFQVFSCAVLHCPLLLLFSFPFVFF